MYNIHKMHRDDGAEKVILLARELFGEGQHNDDINGDGDLVVVNLIDFRESHHCLSLLHNKFKNQTIGFKKWLARKQEIIDYCQLLMNNSYERVSFDLPYVPVEFIRDYDVFCNVIYPYKITKAREREVSTATVSHWFSEDQPAQALLRYVIHVHRSALKHFGPGIVLPNPPFPSNFATLVDLVRTWWFVTKGITLNKDGYIPDFVITAIPSKVKKDYKFWICLSLVFPNAILHAPTRFLEGPTGKYFVALLAQSLQYDFWELSDTKLTNTWPIILDMKMKGIFNEFLNYWHSCWTTN